VSSEYTSGRLAASSRYHACLAPTRDRSGMTPVSWQEMHRGFESSAGATQLHTSCAVEFSHSRRRFDRDDQRSPSVVSLRHKRRH
jgi:hypothetical protein